MIRTRRRLLAFLGAIVLLLALVTAIYWTGMRFIEAKPRSVLDSLEWAAETLTTTGYGRDMNWRHPAMVLFVVLTQFVGVLMIYLLVPIFLIPYLEERFETRLPTLIRPLEDHVILYGYGPAVANLLERLGAAGVASLVVESDQVVARAAVDAGHRTLFGPLTEETLRRAHLHKARALVTNASDEANAATVLAARDLGFTGEILALVHEPAHRHPIQIAGATFAATPRHALGAVLAARASERLTPTVHGVDRLGDRLVVRQIRLRKESSLANQTLAGAAVGSKTGAVVVGQWVNGSLQHDLKASSVLSAGAILIAAGSVESLDRLEGLCKNVIALPQRRIIVAGAGEAGAKASQLLRDVGEEVVVVDRRDGPGVDVVGDILDPATLAKLDLQHARSLLISIDADTAALFATMIVRDDFPDIPILVRVNDSGNLAKLYRAGADFAISLAQVSGQLLAGRLLGGQAVAVDQRIQISRVDAGRLAGSTLRQADLRRATGCSLIAIERDQQILTELDPELVFRESDHLFLCGPQNAVASLG